MPAAPSWSPPLQFGPLSPPAAVVPDAPLAESVHLVLACASDSAASPNAPDDRVGHWAHPPSQKRLSHAAHRILTAAANARRYAPDEPAYSRAEQVVSDALALALHVAQSHGAPTLATGGYPVQQMHAILAEEAGLLDVATANGRGGGGGGKALVLSSAPGLRQVQSWPVDLLACGGRTRGNANAPQPQPQQPQQPPERPTPARGVLGTPDARRAPAPTSTFSRGSGGGGAFSTPLLSQMFATFAKASPVAEGHDDLFGRAARGGRLRRR